MDIAFLLLERAEQPDVDTVIAAAKDAGMSMSLSGAADTDVVQFDVEGGVTVMVMMMDAPHPDTPNMALGPMSPEREALTSASAHAIVTFLGIEGDVATHDRTAAALTAAVIRGMPATAAMLGHGIMFYAADLFADLALAALEEDEVPVEIVVDITAAREDEERMSFLTHGLVRYEREEFYMTAPIQGKGALPFLLDMTRWMIFDPNKQLPTGETIGRDESERIVIQRTPNPTGEGPDVIQLDLPA